MNVGKIAPNMIISRVLSCFIGQNSTFIRARGKEIKALSTFVQTKSEALEGNDSPDEDANKESANSTPLTNYRFLYPEFLPDPNPLYRNSLREKLERIDMLARRSTLHIPEFYVGSILAVTYSEPHATAKVNRFVGICILREGCGLRASFLLRNVVNEEGIEVRYELYDPAIKKIECLRLEKRLDDELLYLRDAPLEYSRFPFEMETHITPPGFVPLNEIKIPLNPLPWSEKWERKNLKGVKEIVVNERRRKKAAAAAKPWEKYDLMKIYRETIPAEEQEEIFSNVHIELSQLELRKSMEKRKQMLERPTRFKKNL